MTVLYAVVAHDGTDAGAPARRLAAREAHLAVARQWKAAGNIRQAGALLDDHGQMVGWVMLVAFESRAELDAWLRNDPYSIVCMACSMHGVWQRVEVNRFQPAPL